MKVTKVLALSEDEVKVLKEAGKLLGQLRDMIQSGDVDSFESDTGGLLLAVSSVAAEVAKKVED